MKSNLQYLKVQITKAVRVYVFGCCVFTLIALASIWVGYLYFSYFKEYDLPTGIIIIPIAGLVLIWEMIKSFNFKKKLPDTYRLVRADDFPALFDIISEITNTLGISPIRRVYICPGTTAAVFIQPKLRNILFEPQKDLVMGLGFLTQMDDSEIRAMLYHEFGHFVQSEMNSSVSVYTIGQFTRSFVSIKEPLDTNDTWKMNTRLQVLLFTCFSIWACNKINRLYLKLSKQMEYDADDVAVKYIGEDTLQRALLHAAYLRYNYEFVQWGIQQLNQQNISVDNEYAALSFVNNYSRPPQDLLCKEVLIRVKRLGNIKSTPYTDVTDIVKTFAVRFFLKDINQAQTCSAMQFALWLRDGQSIYEQLRMLEKSVILNIHLNHKKHSLPLLDGSYKILLDGHPIGIGNFIKGYTLVRYTSPGKHTIKVWSPTGIISTPFEFEALHNKRYQIEMDYVYHKDRGVYDVFAEKIKEL